MSSLQLFSRYINMKQDLRIEEEEQRTEEEGGAEDGGRGKAFD